MHHPIHRVSSFEIAGAYTLRISFDDGSRQIVDFEPVLRGELFGPLLDRNLFERVALDTEGGTLVWPNGADFDPATLHDWPTEGPALAKLAQTWVTVRA